jgi:hypothetical protein
MRYCQSIKSKRLWLADGQRMELRRKVLSGYRSGDVINNLSLMEKLYISLGGNN